jgi:tetratricopeptide (TPR) repeat protein
VLRQVFFAIRSRVASLNLASLNPVSFIRSVRRRDVLQRGLPLTMLGVLSLLIAFAMVAFVRDLGLWWVLVVILSAVGIAALLYSGHAEANWCIKTAGRLLGRGEYRRAIPLLSRAIKLVPYRARAYVSRSLAYTGIGQMDLAVDDAESAVRLAPELPEARLARARVYGYRGLYDDAIRDLQTAISYNPQWLVGYLELARMHIKSQDYHSGLKTLERLRETTTSADARYEAWMLAGWIHEEKLHDMDEAIANYTRAIPILPNRKIGYLRRAYAYRARGDMRQAAEDLLRAAQRLPTPEDNGQYHWLRAICYGHRYTITKDPADLKAWFDALEHSAKDDAPQYGTQAKQWLEMLRTKQTPDNVFPPRPIIYLN